MTFRLLLNHPTQPDRDATLVAISPTDTRWNDFGFNFHAYARFIPSDERDPIRVRLFIIPFDDNGTPIASFQKWHAEKARVEQSGGKLRLDLPTTFNSMIASETDYQSLYDWCNGEDEFFEALETLNELKWLQVQQDASKSIAQATISSQAFQLGVIRTGAAYRAFRHGYSRVVGKYERLDEARVPFRFETKLAGFKTAHSLNVRFNDIDEVPDRVHCIIGANGVGKSRLLASLVERLSTEHTRGGISFHDEPEQEMLPRFNRVLAYTSEIDAPISAKLSNASTLDYQHYSLTAPIGENQDDGHSVSMARMLIDLVREEPLDKGKGLNRLSMFKRSLGRHVDLSLLCIPIEDNSSDAMVFKDLEARKWARFEQLGSVGEQRKLEVTGSLDQTRELGFIDYDGHPIRISSGQRSFTRFCLHFLTFSDAGMLVVMDEPETHLHPNLVSAFCVLLNDVLKMTRSIAVVATHSVFVVRESITQCNHIVRINEDDEVFIEHVYMKTLGASPTSLSISIFGDDLAKKYHGIIAKEIAGNSATMDQVIEKYGNYLSMDMLMEIRERIASSKDGK